MADLIRQEGATKLFTSCFADVNNSPAPFYAQLGFVATGDFDVVGETIYRLELCDPRAEKDHAAQVAHIPVVGTRRAHG